MSFKFKDFLYLDSDFVADLYGQIYQEEIIEKILSSGLSSNEGSVKSVSSSESDSTVIHAGGSLGIASMSGDFSEAVTNSEEEQILFSEETNSNESVTMALNNFKYTKVVENLENKKLLNSVAPHKQYEFIKIDNTFEYYDFDLSSVIFNFNNIVTFLYTTYYNEQEQFFNFESIISDFRNAKQSVKSKKVKSPFENLDQAKSYIESMRGAFTYRNMEVVSNSLATIFKENILLLSNNNEIVICSKEFLKTNSVSLTMSKRIKATVIGRVINNPIESVDANDIGNFLKTDENGDFDTSSMLNGGASFMIMNYLQNFMNIKVEKNLYIIQALGVEYS